MVTKLDPSQVKMEDATSLSLRKKCSRLTAAVATEYASAIGQWQQQQQYRPMRGTVGRVQGVGRLCA